MVIGLRKIYHFIIQKNFKDLSVHYLGGLSTSPNINTIKYYFSTSLFNGIKEF